MNDTNLRNRAIELIVEIRSGSADDERQQRIFAELDRILPDPNYFDYMWNISPARFPDQHQGGIHGAGSAFNNLMQLIGRP